METNYKLNFIQTHLHEVKEPALDELYKKWYRF